jgi:charged multivesicular body protein 5
VVFPPCGAHAARAPSRRRPQVLRQKKLYEGQREQLYQQQYNVESAAFTMQSMQDSVQVVGAMQAGAKQMAAMQKKHKELRVDEVWKTMDQMADMAADFEEVQDAMGSYNVPDAIDDADLDAELDALGDDDALAELAGDGVPAYLAADEELEALPEAPSGAAGVAAGPAAAAAAGEEEPRLPAGHSGR